MFEHIDITKSIEIIGKLSDIIDNEDICKEKCKHNRKATDSFKSFISTLNIDDSKEYLIIKEI